MYLCRNLAVRKDSHHSGVDAHLLAESHQTFLLVV